MLVGAIEFAWGEYVCTTEFGGEGPVTDGGEGGAAVLRRRCRCLGFALRGTVCTSQGFRFRSPLETLTSISPFPNKNNKAESAVQTVSQADK
jgi:hypothetical protein